MVLRVKDGCAICMVGFRGQKLQRSLRGFRLRKNWFYGLTGCSGRLGFHDYLVPFLIHSLLPSAAPS